MRSRFVSRQSQMPIRLLIIVLLTCCWSSGSWAARYGLLVGVGDYKNIRKLSGPVNDVAAIKTALVEHWDFKESNITTILNQEGTKKNILGSIAHIYDITQPGDEVFIYFSGHGTSAGDSDIKTPLPTTTGAFLPYDIDGVKSLDELVSRIIVGVNDLQPVLKPLDEGGRHVFVAIDACYSGNAVRGKMSPVQLPKRFVSLAELLPSEAIKPKKRATVRGLARKVKKSYPYKNVYYLAASGEFEPAQDIPPEFVSKYPTYDGKSHGAFTDTLVRVLEQDAHSDIDRDGTVTYGELKETVQREMRDRGFSHTPQGLPPLYEDVRNLAYRPIFGSAASASAATIAANNIKEKKQAIKRKDNPRTGALTVNLAAGALGLAKSLQMLDNVKVVTGNASMFVRSEGGYLLFISGAGDLIMRLPSSDQAAAIEMIQHQAWINSIVNQKYANAFPISLEYDTPGRGSAAIDGDDIGFTFKASEPSYLMLVDIDPQGVIHVIYPYSEDELFPVAANTMKAFPELATVTAPYGRDYIQVYAFKDYSASLKNLMGQSIDKNSPLLNEFKKLISNKSLVKSRTSLELVTASSY